MYVLPEEEDEELGVEVEYLEEELLLLLALLVCLPEVEPEDGVETTRVLELERSALETVPVVDGRVAAPVETLSPDELRELLLVLEVTVLLPSLVVVRFPE